MVKIDRTNLELIRLLQRDARTSVSDLARLVRRGETTVRDRLTNLEYHGVIRGYTADVDYERIGFPVRALLRARGERRSATRIGRQLAAIPNLTQASLITGSRPFQCEVRVPDLISMERTLEERFSPLGLDDVEVCAVLRDLLPARPLPALAPSGPGPLEHNGNGAHLVSDNSDLLLP